MENHPPSSHREYRRYVLTLIALLLEVIICACYLISIPSGASTGMLLGLTKERLLMLSLFLLFFILCSYLVLNILTKQCLPSFLTAFISHHKKKIIVTLQIISLSGLLLLLLPAYRFDPFSAYYVRLRPFILFFFLFSITLLSSIYLTIQTCTTVLRNFSGLSTLKKAFLFFSSISLLLLGIIERTGLGKTPENSLWNKNGIPLQSIQFFFIILLWLLIQSFTRSRLIKFRSNALPFFLIWSVAAVLWSCAPNLSHFFAPGPYEPNNVLYPYSDAMGYDIGAQTALNGWGFNFGWSVNKPVVTYLLFLFHMATGNNFSLSIILQSACFGILPSLLFLFGTELKGRRCGFLAAAFCILQEWNALHTYQVMTITSRLMMSEFIMQILFISFCYCMFRWLKKDDDQIVFAAAAGGFFALGINTRFNFYAFLPAILLILIITYFKKISKLLRPALIFSLAIIITALPWEIRNFSRTGTVLPEFIGAIDYVLFGQRLKIEEPAPAAPQVVELQEVSPTQTEEKELSDLEKTSLVTQEEVITPEIISSETITSKDTVINTKQETPILKDFKDSLIFSILNHSMHNILSGFYTLPLSFSFDDLSHIYENTPNGLWGDDWKGDLPLPSFVAALIWLMLFCLTFASIWNQYKFAGLSLLYFWFVFALSLGISRSSGGRYIVPMNWFIWLFTAYGICLLFPTKEQNKQVSEKTTYQHTKRKTVFIFVTFLLFFTSMNLFEILLPRQYINTHDKETRRLNLLLQKETNETLLKSLSTSLSAERLEDMTLLKNNLVDSRIDWPFVEEQISTGIMKLTRGEALYPRFYYFYKGEHGSNPAFAQKDYSRLVFTGISDNPKDYMLPHTEQINEFPDGSTFVALSCLSSAGFYDVLGIVINTQEGETISYIRDPLPTFSCPINEPVCTETEKCY